MSSRSAVRSGVFKFSLTEVKFMRVMRSQGNFHDTYDVSRETSIDCSKGPPSKTIQSARDDADINVIVRRFGVTKQLPQVLRVPSYGDYEGVGDFQTAMNVVRQANEAFMELPSSIRNKFGNSPQAYLEFVSDPANLPDMVKLGLATKVDLPDNAPASHGASKEDRDGKQSRSRGRSRDADRGTSARESSGRGSAQDGGIDSGDS